MNFMQLLKSLDELLFEVMSWLVFFPLTLWRTIRHPLHMMEYADAELLQTDEQQYDDTLSPPLFLLLALGLSHVLELAATGGAVNPLVASHSGLAAFVTDDTSLLAMRLAIFSLIPLMLAVSFLMGKGQRITRDRLQPPFYAQCYPAAPFALLIGGSGLLMQQGGLVVLVGLLAFVTVIIAYFVLQIFWFRHHLRIGRVRALALVTVGFMTGLLFAGIALFLLS